MGGGVWLKDTGRGSQKRSGSGYSWGQNL